MEKQSTNVGPPESKENREEMPRVPELPAKPTVPKQDSVDGSVVDETKATLSASQKTRTRSIRPPSRFKDYVLSR